MIQEELVVVGVVLTIIALTIYFLYREQKKEEKDLAKRRTQEKKYSRTRLPLYHPYSEWSVEDDEQEKDDEHTGFKVVEERNLSDLYEDADTVEDCDIQFEQTQPDIFVPKVLREAEPPNMASPEPEASTSFDTGGYPPLSKSDSPSEEVLSCSSKSSGWSTGGGNCDYSDGSLFGSGSSSSDSGFSSGGGSSSCDD